VCVSVCVCVCLGVNILFRTNLSNQHIPLVLYLSTQYILKSYWSFYHTISLVFSLVFSLKHTGASVLSSYHGRSKRLGAGGSFPGKFMCLEYLVLHMPVHVCVCV